MVEILAPSLENFPVDIRKPDCSICFLGQPIDYVFFDPDVGVTFIEVKSGNSKLTSQQKKIREHIKNGKVFWADYRLK